MTDHERNPISLTHGKTISILKSPEVHQGSIFRAKAEVRAMRITSLSSAPACKLSMPGDTQVLSATRCRLLHSLRRFMPPMLPFLLLLLCLYQCDPCVPNKCSATASMHRLFTRQLACSVRLSRIGLAEPPFLVSASVAHHAL